MASPHRRSKDRRARGPSARPSSPAQQRRARSDSPRSLLIGAWVTTLFALLCVSLATLFTITEYRKCGHIHIDLLLTGVAASTTIGTVYAWYTSSRTRRAARLPTGPPPTRSGASSAGPNAPKSRGGA
ncbi:MAG: hypothetical protein ACKVW3_14975 [Phycisphaerales bacterium]